jgi:hypothetical protein
MPNPWGVSLRKAGGEMPNASAMDFEKNNL